MKLPEEISTGFIIRAMIGLCIILVANHYAATYYYDTYYQQEKARIMSLTSDAKQKPVKDRQ